ncbi:MAG TPA: hypothetical protein VE781_02330 [Kineosporiaceae bacterium]|nr:hypothetical protein [Kineosporiaceae bacterium]
MAAVLVLLVGLGTALLTPVAAAVSAQRVTPPGSIALGQASVIPADGWVVEDRDSTAVLLTRAGARMVVRWVPGAPQADPEQALGALAADTQRSLPDARSFGQPRQFGTPTGDPGYLAPFAAPGSTGAIALVRSPQGQVTVQALATTTTFASLSDEMLGMITSIRIRRGGAA